MGRTARVEVRPLVVAELDGTRTLWEQAAREAEPHHPVSDVDEVLGRVRDRLVESDRAERHGLPPSFRVAIAWTPQGEPVGLVVMRVGDSGPFVTRALAVVDLVHVAPEVRRAGVGRALLGAVASFAAATGSQEVSVHVPTSAREANRFYAGWGFAPLTTRRGTTLANLQRRLPGDLELAEQSRLRLLRRRRAVLGGRVVRTARVSPR